MVSGGDEVVEVCCGWQQSAMNVFSFVSVPYQ